MATVAFRCVTSDASGKKDDNIMVQKTDGEFWNGSVDQRERPEGPGEGSLPTEERPSRRRIGVLSFSSPGHYYPLTALARRLRSRGHEVVYFQVADLERPIRAAGIKFHQIGAEDFPLGSLRARQEALSKLRGLSAVRRSLRGINLKAEMLFRDAPAAIRDEGIDSLIVDQIEAAGGTVAEHLCLPFVSVAVALPINSDPLVPHCTSPWLHRTGVRARLRNRVSNATFEWMFSGLVRTINRQRRAWGLPGARNVQSLLSKRLQVTQLPAAFELPGRQQSLIRHTGPWTDAAGRGSVEFPWSRIDPKRSLVYASMGTLQNGVLETFRTIAEACAEPDLQLVISLGGGGQDPALLAGLAGDPVVVGYAPQLELIERAALTISHGGLNTALESLARGVPMVVLPVTYDQPGVGARVEWSGVGRSIPIGRLSPQRLGRAIRAVLGDAGYRARAAGIRASIEAVDGLNGAADLIEAAFAKSGHGVRRQQGPAVGDASQFPGADT